MLDPISSRTVSAFPLSVGTSLAFESCFDPVQPPIDPNRVIPQEININDYTQLWVNVGTLFRNLYNSINKDGVRYLTFYDCADALASEMEIINDLVISHSTKPIETVFYICDYSDLSERFKFGNPRTPRTPLQTAYANLYLKTLELIKRRSRTSKIREVREYKSKFSGGNAKALILTHFPIDLLNYGKFKELDLLESHTGILKKRPDWYTKYYDGRDLNMLPLNGILLTVFGDDHHYRPQPKAMKESLLTLAKERKWNCLTTPREVVNGIKTMKDHALREALLMQEQY